MLKYFYLAKPVLCLSVILLIVQQHSILVNSAPVEFSCSRKPGDALPYLPLSYSTDMRLNFPKQQYTVEARHVRNALAHKEAYEFRSEKRRVKYILRGDEKVILMINYLDDEYPKCTVKKYKMDEDFLESDDSGPNGIISKLVNAIGSRDGFYQTDVSLDNGIYIKRWEGCFTDPRINISLDFSGSPIWKHSRKSSLRKNASYLVKADAKIGNDYTGILFSNFDPSTPDDSEFQPPENTFCEGFREDRKVPQLPDYFSYNAEIVVYESPEGIAPIVSHRKVYYDYPGGISRTDFYDPLSENEDMFSPIRAKQKSIIHDFNSGVEYTIDPVTGKCDIDPFQTTLSVITVKEKMDEMPNAKKFFGLNGAKISYNGQYSTRGLMTDVYTGSLTTKEGASIYSWYFTVNKTQVVEKGNVEKNVLLRMVVRPKTGSGKERVAEINFYNFIKEEPSFLLYDMTGCYNQSFSKNLVLTFTGDNQLRGMETRVQIHIQLALKNLLGIRMQRLFVREVTVSEEYVYAELKLLDSPSAIGKVSKPVSNEPTLEEAFSRLKAAVENNNISISVPTKSGKDIVLRIEPDGLNVFSGDRSRKPTSTGYKEGSVIGLTIVMLVLGLILGGITVNLIVSKKFGVSLFQKNAYGDSFNNPLNESSM